MSNPGRLREKFTIQVADRAVADELGRPDSGVDAQWQDAATVRGEITENLSSSEERGGRNNRNQRITAKMRDHPKLSIDSRLIWRGKTLRIQSIRQSGRLNRYREVECIYSGD